MDFLSTNLLDLAHELRGDNIPLIVGGGFGLFLKRNAIQASGERTLLGALHEARPTNIIDLFLHAEIIADLDRFGAIREALDRLGYEAEADEEMRFIRCRRDLGAAPSDMKREVLIGSVDEFDDQSQREIESSQIQAREPHIELRVHSTAEAIGIGEESVNIPIEGFRSNGERAVKNVFVPQMFPDLMMALHAFDDRMRDPRSELGQHHVVDLYTIVATATEFEYIRAIELGRELKNDARVINARRIIKESFSEETSPGVLRLREHPLFRQRFQIRDFLGILDEIFIEPLTAR